LIERLNLYLTLFDLGAVVIVIVVRFLIWFIRDRKAARLHKRRHSSCFRAELLPAASRPCQSSNTQNKSFSFCQFTKNSKDLIKPGSRSCTPLLDMRGSVLTRGRRMLLAAADLLMPLLKLLAVALYLPMPVEAER
jgi:hypothetical protein